MKTPLHHWMLRLATTLIAGSCFDEACPATNFPIATTSALESGFTAAFDGSNYLVAVRGGPLAEGAITAQMVSRAGALVCPPIYINETGGLPQVAFDGQNYFLVSGGSSATPGFKARFVNKACEPGAEIVFPTGPETPHTISLAFGAGKYLACWSDSSSVRGQLVSPEGFLDGDSFLVSGSVQRARENAIGFDGTNFFVVFNGGGNIRPNIYGQFLTPAGALHGGMVPINTSTNPCDNPLSVAFDGVNYLVTFNEQVGGEEGAFHIFARLVSPSGTVSTNKIIIGNGPGVDLFPFSACDASSYLVAWSQGTSLTNLTLTLRFFDRAGQPLGPEFAPFSAQGRNRPVFGAPLFDGERFLVTAVSADLTPEFTATSSDIYGTFLRSSTATPRLDAAGAWVGGQFPMMLTGTPGISYAIEMKTSLRHTSWMPLVTNSPTDETFTFVDAQATNTSRFYRAARP